MRSFYNRYGAKKLLNDCQSTHILERQKTHVAYSRKILNQLNNALYEIEPAEIMTEHTGKVTVGFLILQKTKLRLFQNQEQLFTKLCDVSKCEGLDMDTDSLWYLISLRSSKKVVSILKREKMGATAIKGLQ